MLYQLILICFRIQSLSGFEIKLEQAKIEKSCFLLGKFGAKPPTLLLIKTKSPSFSHNHWMSYTVSTFFFTQFISSFRIRQYLVHFFQLTESKSLYAPTLWNFKILIICEVPIFCMLEREIRTQRKSEYSSRSRFSFQKTNEMQRKMMMFGYIFEKEKILLAHITEF